MSSHARLWRHGNRPRSIGKIQQRNLAAASASQREVNDLIPEFIWAGRRPDEPQVIEDGADVHAPRELDDAWNMAPERQVIVEMARHGARLLVINIQRESRSRSRSADQACPGRCAVVFNRIHAQVRRHLRQLRLDEWRDVLIEQEADRTHAGAATRARCWSRRRANSRNR